MDGHTSNNWRTPSATPEYYKPDTGMRGVKHFIGVQVFLLFHSLILGGKFGRIPQWISDDAFSQGYYSLDAPQYIPAGGCCSSPDTYEDDIDSHVADQIIIDRETLE